MAALCLLDDNGLMANRWEIGENPLAVGRDQSADITVEDGALSRRHFEVQRTKEGVTIKDLDSQNGTWVAGKRAGSTKLKHHDCIVAGRTIFLYDDQNAAKAISASQAAAKLSETALIPASS